MTSEGTNKMDIDSMGSRVRAAEVTAEESRRRFETAADHLSEKVEGTAHSLGKAKDILAMPKHLIEDVKASANRLLESDYAKKVKENPAPYIAGAAAFGILAIATTFYFMRRRQNSNLLQIAEKRLRKWDF